jgi:hypothetical protein
MRRLLPLFILLALVALLPAGAAGAKTPKCRAGKGDIVVKRTVRVLVYERDNSVVACVRPDGRHYALGQDDGEYRTITIDAISGTTVTWTASYIPECKADCPPGVTGFTHQHKINLRTGRRTQLS